MSALPRSPAPVAPEHVTRLLHAMDEDFDELITDADLTAFVARHGLAHLFPDELLASMFAEANATGDGFLDAEQLGKAVSRKFPNRKHNDDWHRLFDLAPRPPNAARITELSPRPPEQEPIRANFEQEPQILTFSPLTNPRGVICRVTGEPATTPLRLQATENSRHGLANSMRHAVGEWGGGASGEFTCVFGKADAQTIKRVAAQDRLEAAKGTEPPPMIAYLCGKPSAHDFRPPLDPSRMPEGEGTAAFKTSTLGRHWPVREGMIVSDLRQANPPLSCPPLRVALTENTHPAARSTRAALKS